ncbi:MAG: Abi family protein [Verrucomicrobia bacterium]|nr:Abi family protein [Verrucomicrobiota bacterium]
MTDRDQLLATLRRVSYYRLSGYWHPFREADDRFRAGTTLEMIWDRYTFDRQLRLLVLDAVERVEIAVLRTAMVELHARSYGPFGYRQPTAFHPAFATIKPDGRSGHDRMIEDIDRSTAQSKETFVEHFRTKYVAELALPLWMAAEVASFGNLLTFFRNLNHADKMQIAKAYGLPAKVLENWLLCLGYVRNLCAHHARLWNRELAIRPMIPHKDPVWQTPLVPDNRRIYAVLSLLRSLLKDVAPSSLWPARLDALLAKYPVMPLAPMGFPSNWKATRLWAASPTT